MAFIRHFCPKWPTVTHTYKQWWQSCKVPTSTSGTHLEFNSLPKDSSTCRPGESCQRLLDNQTLSLPLSHIRSTLKLLNLIIQHVFMLNSSFSFLKYRKINHSAMVINWAWSHSPTELKVNRNCTTFVFTLSDYAPANLFIIRFIKGGVIHLKKCWF